MLKKGSWLKTPPSAAFSDPSPISRMKIQVEQVILKFFLAKKNYHVLDISAVVGARIQVLKSLIKLDLLGNTCSKTQLGIIAFF